MPQDIKIVPKFRLNEHPNSKYRTAGVVEKHKTVDDIDVTTIAYVDTRFNNKTNIKGFADTMISPFPFIEYYEPKFFLNLQYLIKNPLNQTAYILYFDMIDRLENDCNYVHYMLKGNTDHNEPAIVEAVNLLCNKKYLCRTNKKFIYIINHNVCFKGDLNKFRNTYKQIYGDEEPIFTHFGDVVINRYYDRRAGEIGATNVSKATFEKVKEMSKKYNDFYK